MSTEKLTALLAHRPPQLATLIAVLESVAPEAAHWLDGHCEWLRTTAMGAIHYAEAMAEACQQAQKLLDATAADTATAPGFEFTSEREAADLINRIKGV